MPKYSISKVLQMLLRTVLLTAILWCVPMVTAVPHSAPLGLEWVGNPIADRPYTARGIRDLQVWQGRVYLGYGDWYANLGPIDIWGYDPITSEFISETVYVNPDRPAAPVDEESIDRYCVIDEDLYIPGTDPCCGDGWDFGNFYRNDGTGWVKKRTIPTGLHAFDMLRFQGRLFVATGPNDGKALKASDDDGETWVPVIDGLDNTRFYELFEQGGTLYAVKGVTQEVPKAPVYLYDGAVFQLSGRDLLPDVGSGYYAVRDGVHNFGDEVVYIAWEWDDTAECYRPMHALYHASPGADGQRIPFFDDKVPRDVVVNGDEILVLDSGSDRCIFSNLGDPDPTGYTATIYSSTDLVNWEEVVSESVTDTPNALEVLGDRTYVGTYNGDIYHTPPTPTPTPVPVGGVVVPVSEVELLAPWVGLVTLVALATLAVALVRRPRV